MATANLSAIGGLLKRTYKDPIREQMNNSSVLYFRLAKEDDEELFGEDLTARISLAHARNQGISWRAEGGTIGAAGTRRHTHSTIAPAYVYGQIRLSRQAIKATRRQEGRFAALVDNEVGGMVEGLKIEVNRSMWGDGSGAMARITQATGAIAAGTLFTVDDASRLESGMIIDSWSAKSGGAQGLNSVTIDQVDYRNNKISLTTMQTVTLNDYIFREDSRGLVMMGIEGIVDGLDSAGARIITTLQGISRSSNLWWEGNVVDNGGTLQNLALTRIQQTFELGEIMSSGRTSVIASGYDMRRAYIDLTIADRRYVNHLSLDGGFRALEYTGGGEPVPWVAERHGKKNTIYFLDERTLKVYRASDFDWIDEDGAVFRKVQDVDEFEATCAAYLNLGVSSSNKNSVLRDQQ